jgi:SprT protein
MNNVDRCVEEVIKAYEVARKKLGIVMKFPRITFDLTGSTAGKAFYRENRIAFNPKYLQRNTEDFLARTPWHEVAHLISFRKYGGNIRPHGDEWTTIMWTFGKPATRCHNYNSGHQSPITICREIT